MLQIHTYKGNSVTFNTEGETYINATEMAKPFGKKVSDFLRLKATKGYLSVLESDTLITASLGIVSVTKGNFSDGTAQGTWMHELLAIEFAGWLAPEFKLWCNKRIREILLQATNSTPALPEARLSELEQRIAKLETSTNESEYLTIRQFAFNSNTYISRELAIRIGKLAVKQCAYYQQPVKPVYDHRYGSIGSYPKHILEECIQTINF